MDIAAFESGELKFISGDGSRGEIVLCVPLNRLLVKVVRLSAEQRADVVGAVQPLLQAMSPFTGEQLTIGYEVVEDTGAELTVLAAAFPENAADNLAEQLDAHGLNVTRIDATVLGEIRDLWDDIKSEEGVRKLVLLESADCLAALVLEGGRVCAVRAFSLGAELKREVMLLLLDAESFAGVRPLSEIVTVGAIDGEGLKAFAPVRALSRQGSSLEAATAGLIARAQDPAALDVLPENWRVILEETRFKAKLKRRLIVAFVAWGLVMAVLFGVPMFYNYLTGREKARCKAHSRQFQAVREMRDKVMLVRKYSDHDHGALEIMKAISDRLPQGITLTSWNFKREDGLKLSGEADSAELVYEFKNAVAELADEGAEVPLFPVVELKGPTASKGKQKFDIDCRYQTEEN